VEEKHAKQRRRRRTLFAIIATLITWWVGAWLRPQFIPAPSLYAHTDAPLSAERSAKLPDETQVTLAPGSQLSYLKWLSPSDEHTLHLDGEGTFSIPPGPRPPVMVVGAGIEVKAFEGRFTVQAYNAVPIAYVKVHEGRAQVRARTVFGFGEFLTVHAGEGVRVGPGQHIERVDVPIGAHSARNR
jgi:ferric-dicitrate binding protein FerR (iron transport regulator)